VGEEDQGRAAGGSAAEQIDRRGVEAVEVPSYGAVQLRGDPLDTDAEQVPTAAAQGPS
jgi:hypothetical protein